ncbi:MAG: PAS domain S-box protein, partial [Actinobacteria bacterium]|nr:PAS domain S-box protein [Actinomycetota bacterium]
MDPDLRVTYANQAALGIFGFTREDLDAGTDVFALLSPEDRQAAQERLLRVASGEKVAPFVCRAQRKDGASICFEATTAAIRETEGRLVGFGGVVRDVTARRPLEVRLGDSDVQFKLAQRLAQFGMWSMDLVEHTLTWSAELYRIHGRDRELPAPGPDEFADCFTPESHALLEAAIAEAVSGGDLKEIELEIVRPDGDHRWLAAAAEPVRDETGRVVRIHGIAQDITEKKLAERAIRESNERYQMLLENTTDAIYAVDRELRYTVANRVACEQIGLPAEEILGKTCFDLGVPEDTARKWTEVFSHVLESGETLSATSNPVMPDGSERTHKFTLSPLRGEAGDVVGVRGVSRDVTDRAQAQKALAESEARYRSMVESF